MSVQSYRDLDIWKRAMELAEAVYLLTRNFPREERYGMTSQMRRSAASIPANIAEGWSRGTKEFNQFLNIARGSLRELETHLLLSQRVGLCSPEAVHPLLENAQILGKQILTLQRKLRQRLSG